MIKGNPALPGFLSVYVSIRCFPTFYIFVVQSDLLKSWNFSCIGSSVVVTQTGADTAHGHGDWRQM